jgi:TetR/AcrR family transcriptional regulator, fatty acid metabolism regulator protein
MREIKSLKPLLDKGSVQSTLASVKVHTTTERILEMYVEEKKRRYKPAVRKAQIIETTKELILENGLGWASSLRIAKALGISQAALYHHFTNKREILLTTLSSIVHDIVFKTMATRSNEDIEDYIREAAYTFYDMTIADPRQSRLLVEYLCAPPTETMREEVQMIFSGLIDMAEELMREGIASGRFKEDLDVSAMAWVFVSLAVTFSIGTMLEVPKLITKEQALSAIDVILQAIKK